DWANPHAHIFITVADGQQAGRWYVELESTTLLERNGWSEDTVRIGDHLAVTGMRARDGSTQLWGTRVTRADGGDALFTVSETLLDAAQAKGAGEAVPRWPDGQPRLGAEPGETGYWIPTTNVILENGVEVAMSPHG